MYPTLIELHIPDFEKAKNFYEELGFSKIWERKPEDYKGYLVMQMEGSIICFWGGNNSIYFHEFFKEFPKDTPRGYGVELVIQTNNLDTVYLSAQKLGVAVEDLQTRPWKLRDFRIKDPFGFYLRFTSPHDITDPKNAVD